MKLMVPQHSRLLMIWLIFFCLLFLSLGTFFCHFNSLSSNKTLLVCCTSTVSNIIQWKDIENDHASSLSLKPSPNLQLLVNQFNNATPENRNYPEKISSSKYYDTEETHNIERPQNNKSLSLFHINPFSFNRNFDDLQHLLSCPKKYFELTAISEPGIIKQVSLLYSFNLNNHSFEFTPTETSPNNTLLLLLIICHINVAMT